MEPLGDDPHTSGTANRSLTEPTGQRGPRLAGHRSRSSVGESPSTRTVTLAEQPAPAQSAASRDCCTGADANDDWNAAARGETIMQRLDRNYAEILQEIRVAQTGVQLLLAFLLSLAFTPRFISLTPFDRSLYVTTLILGSSSAALLMAPACYHRMVFRQRLKRHLVRAASRFAATGLGLLGLSLASAVLLILRVVVNAPLAVVLTTGVLVWFFLWWYALPLWTSRRHRH